eukprot:12200482-Prorocentrum_lima.AAC.1
MHALGSTAPVAAPCTTSPWWCGTRTWRKRPPKHQRHREHTPPAIMRHTAAVARLFQQGGGAIAAVRGETTRERE